MVTWGGDETRLFDKTLPPDQININPKSGGYRKQIRRKQTRRKQTLRRRQTRRKQTLRKRQTRRRKN
jgi:hypothetical protein